MDRRALLIGGGALLAACGRRPVAAQSDSELGFDARLPWDDPRNERYARTQPAPTHGNTHGMALSWDGRLIAAAIALEPVNQMTVIDPKAKVRRRFASPHDRLALADPAFSPDGRTLAMVATPHSGTREFGIGEIYLLDLDSGRARRIGGGQESFRYPAFSPDGTKLAYWKGLDPGPNKPGAMRDDFRDFHQWGLHERDLKTGSERLLDPLPFGIVGPIAYDGRGRGWFFEAMDPYAGVLKGDRLAFADYDHFQRIGYQRTFLLQPGKALGASPTPYVTAQSEPLQGAKISGAMSNGNILLETGQAGGPEKAMSFGVVFDGKAIVSYIEAHGTPGGGLQHVACSWDGGSFAGVSDHAKTNRSPIEQTLWWRPAGAAAFSPVDYLGFSHDDPPEPIQFD